MTKSGNKPGRGRPRGLVRLTCVSHGGYTEPHRLGELLKFWRKHKPCNFYRVQEIIQKYLRQLRWDTKHLRFSEVRDVAILTVSRSELFMLIVEKEFTRNFFDKKTGNFIKQRPCDQLRTLERLDDDIQNRIRELGLLSKNNIKKETK